jgi:hypothetical protein
LIWAACASAGLDGFLFLALSRVHDRVGLALRLRRGRFSLGLCDDQDVLRRDLVVACLDHLLDPLFEHWVVVDRGYLDIVNELPEQLEHRRPDVLEDVRLDRTLLVGDLQRVHRADRVEHPRLHVRDHLVVNALGPDFADLEQDPERILGVIGDVQIDPDELIVRRLGFDVGDRDLFDRRPDLVRRVDEGQLEMETGRGRGFAYEAAHPRDGADLVGLDDVVGVPDGPDRHESDSAVHSPSSHRRERLDARVDSSACGVG